MIADPKRQPLTAIDQTSIPQPTSSSVAILVPTNASSHALLRIPPPPREPSRQCRDLAPASRPPTIPLSPAEHLPRLHPSERSKRHSTRPAQTPVQQHLSRWLRLLLESGRCTALLHERFSVLRRLRWSRRMLSIWSSMYRNNFWNHHTRNDRREQWSGGRRRWCCDGHNGQWRTCDSQRFDDQLQLLQHWSCYNLQQRLGHGDHAGDDCDG